MDEPRLEEVMLAAVETMSEGIHVCLPGKVQSWSRTTETATVVPMVRQPGGDAIPVVTGVKVVFPGVYWDLQVGETGLLLFSDWDFSRWWRSGSAQEPEHLGTHDLASALFVPGLKNKAASRNVPVGATVLDGNDVRLGDDGATDYVHKGTTYAGHERAFLDALVTWTNAASLLLATIDGTFPANVNAPFAIALAAFKANITNDLSTKVKVS